MQIDILGNSTGNTKWYALKVFYNKVNPIIEQLNIDGFQSYIPMHLVENKNHNGYEKKPLISSLLFINVTEEYAGFIQQKFDQQMMFYKMMDRKTPAIIPDSQMRNFILCTSIQESGHLEVIADRPDYHQGERVRVIKGTFQGLEGVIKRIKKDRKLIVAIQGVVAVATEYIPRDFLERID